MQTPKPMVKPLLELCISCIAAHIDDYEDFSTVNPDLADLLLHHLEKCGSLTPFRVNYCHPQTIV